MPGFCDNEYGCTGRLTLNTVDMHNPAWVTPLLTKLWFQRIHRHLSTLMPGAAGRRSEPEFFDEVDIVIPIYFNGLVDPDGIDYADAWDGLRQNFELFEASITDPSVADVDRGTIPLSLEMPDGVTTRTAEVQVTLDVQDEILDPSFVIGVLTIRVPAGHLA